MHLKNLTPERIRELNEQGKQLENVTVKILSHEEKQEAKTIIEKILPPKEKGYVTMGYVQNVLFALECSKTDYKQI